MQIRNFSKIINTTNQTNIFRNLYNTFITNLLLLHHKATSSVIFLIHTDLN